MKGHAVPIANHAVVLPDELKKDVGLRIHLSPITVTKHMVKHHHQPLPVSHSPDCTTFRVPIVEYGSCVCCPNQSGLYGWHTLLTMEPRQTKLC